MREIAIGDLTTGTATWDPRRHPDVEFPYIDLATVDNDTKRLGPPATVRGSDAPSRARQLVSAGDVLVSTVRPNRNAVAVVPESLDGATASTGFVVLRPERHLDGRYLFHWVRSPRFVAHLVRLATGASYPAVSDRTVRESAIPCPPLAQQRRLAGILDRADAVRATRRRILGHLDTLTQSVFADLFGHTRWDTVRFGDVVTRIDSGTSPRCAPRPAGDGEWGVLKLSAVTSGVFRHGENKAYPGDIGAMAANEVVAGDILMTRKNTRDLVGAVAIVGDVPPRLLLPDLLYRLHPDTARVDRTYLAALLTHPRTRARVRDLASGAAASMPNISKTRLSALPIELPPLALQREFASRADHVDRARAAARQALTADDELFAALQSRAFRGELQDSAHPSRTRRARPC